MINKNNGYMQLWANKKRLLDSYNIAFIRSKGHAIHTSHGNVAEAEFRKWLEKFLPKKYGVTSGYVVSQNTCIILPQLLHYDVIIYNALECPILDIEENPDESTQGKKRVIPAEFVRAVIEVKSTLSLKTIKDANKKLKELNCLLFDFEKDNINNPYNGKLDPNFFTVSVFFELKSSDFTNENLFRNLVDVEVQRHFTNIILRAEGEDEEITGMSNRLCCDEKIDICFNTLLNTPILCDKLFENKYEGVSLTWSKSNFSIFAFSVLNLLNGTYRQGYVPSFYGLNF